MNETKKNRVRLTNNEKAILLDGIRTHVIGDSSALTEEQTAMLCQKMLASFVDAVAHGTDYAEEKLLTMDRVHDGFVIMMARKWGVL